MNSTLEGLRPAGVQRVYDAVREAGHDVSDWGNFSRGEAWAAANPKYCYEWAFVHPERSVVLNLWFGGMYVEDGQVLLTDNHKELAEFYSAGGGKSVWVARALRFDAAVRTAAVERLPIRAVICDGHQRDRNDVHARASKVTARRLDPVPWAVVEYRELSGHFKLRRGPLPERLVDQFSAEEALPPERRSVTGTVFERDARVRSAVRARANGRCELCSEIGFAMPDGSVYLEVHHVDFLSDGGVDTPDNVVALCPNHHREAHFGSKRDVIRERLLEVLKHVNAAR